MLARMSAISATTCVALLATIGIAFSEPVDESAPAGMTAGIWDCEVGRWRIQMDPTEHEYMVVLAGRCRLHATDGRFTEAGPGEALVIPAGFAGSFEVLETLRKHFVIVVGPDTAEVTV